MAAGITPLRVAILVNHPPNTKFWLEVKQAFSDAFSVVAPHAVIDFYDPIEARQYPDPLRYDLIILSGGKADASASEPWILQMLDWIRTTCGELHNTKVLGICWGHQAIQRAFGGKVAAVPTGPIAGLLRVDLTDAGKEFFPTLSERGSYLASQFHVREVVSAASGFTALAADNESFVSISDKILSFQAHPEINGEFSKKILEDDDTTYVEGLTREEIENMIRTVGDKQDGLDLLRRVVQWVSE